MEENLNQDISPVAPAKDVPTPPVNQPPFGSWWRVGVLVVGVLLAGSIVYAGYQYSQKQAPSVAQPTPTPVAVVTPTPDETANWKTYANSTLGFLIKYPREWFVEEQGSSDEDQSVRLQNYDLQTAPGRGYIPEDDKGKIAISIYKWKGNAKTIDGLKGKINSATECFYVGDPAGERLVFNEQTKIINGIPSYSRDTRCSDAPQVALTPETYLFDGKGKVILVILALDVKAGKLHLDQILSTFQFTQ